MKIEETKNWFILKIAQRCNINCRYCYVYNRGDESWKNRPAFMSTKVAHKICDRVIEYTSAVGLRDITFEIHGGEPLLLGVNRFVELIAVFKKRCLHLNPLFVLQTNGLLLKDEWLEAFDRLSVRFGISLDGPPEIANRNRVDHLGEGTGELLLRVVAQLKKKPLFQKLFSGALCVIDPSVSGSSMVKWFQEYGLDSFSFLLPDGNYLNLPQNWTGTAPYTNFLIDAYDTWFELGRSAPHIRLFDQLSLGFMGIRPGLDSLGADIRGMAAFETNGAMAPHDVIRICGGKYSQDLLSVFNNSISEIDETYDLIQLQKVADKCKRCSYFKNCGGGYLAHRFDGESFQNPSIYCDTLFALSEHIHDKLTRSVPQKYWHSKKTKVEQMGY